ncbi:solute carrier family 25 member 45-like [Physella acuta]|uniref:solute carrier family 25 member 45-like n=1 Tax=Physella acuta TaxID=109671 RepID=UPI0027DCB2F1|nr:solute carrier family 25 member 45-like [Physella acuta]
MAFNDFVAGALGGMAGVVLGHPFDTVKLQMQIRTSGDHNLHRLRDAWSSVAVQGLRRGLYRGMMFPLCSYGLVNSIFFGAYGNMLHILEPDNTVVPSNLQVYLAGCAAGAAQLVMACPVEVIKCTLQAQIPFTLPKSGHSALHATPVMRKNYYEGPFECTKDICKREGFKGFYKGIYPMFIRDVPSFGLYLCIYESLYQTMTHNGFSDSKGVTPAIISGGVAGCVSWVSTMPFDVIKSRLQVDHGGRYDGLWDCVYKTVKNGGISVLFRGTVITVIRAFPVNAVTFLVYSQLLKELNAFNPPKRMRTITPAE